MDTYRNVYREKPASVLMRELIQTHHKSAFPQEIKQQSDQRVWPEPHKSLHNTTACIYSLKRQMAYKVQFWLYCP